MDELKNLPMAYLMKIVNNFEIDSDEGDLMQA